MSDKIINQALYSGERTGRFFAMKIESQEKESEIRRKIIQVCQRLYQRNMLAAADGNVSYRLSDKKILITPTGKPKAFIGIDDIAIVNIEGGILEGQPSSEKMMHLQIYRSCPQAVCVVHAHPPTAIAWSIAYPELKELPSSGLSEVILAVGKIPFVPYARPGTIDMGEVLKSYLPELRAMILSRHGALTWGESLDEAVGGMERIEHSCEILFKAERLGGITDLPKEEVNYLKELRRKIGDKIL